MEMESSSIELKVMSCKDLKFFNFFQKLSVYSVVSIVSDDSKKKKQRLYQQKTPVEQEGDGNPEWNHEMRFDLKDISFTDCNHIFIEFDLRCAAVIFGDKTIGEVQVPLTDLIEEFNGGVRYVSYQIRTSDGKPNGVLNFSYKLNDKEKKMGSGLQDNEIGGFPIVQYPPLDVQFSSPEVHYPSLEVHYPSVDIEYPPQEVYFPVNPPPPPPPPHMVYPPPPPAPYGFESWNYEPYDYRQYGYPPPAGSVDALYGNTWQMGGSWNCR